ncbi:MAG: RtcB family protein [Deltaproteobacteria bacterium]|nr:RtcB family protein [Deltaproteobacteria bacterium]
MDDTPDAATPSKPSYEVFSSPSGYPIKSWTVGVEFEEGAKAQLRRMAALPFIHKWLAVMPDVHGGAGATVGSVIPTRGAVIPAAVGVDIGCGMMAVRTDLPSHRLPDDLRALRAAIEAAVPHGRTHDGRAGDRGAWGTPPPGHVRAWTSLAAGYDAIVAKHPKIGRGPRAEHLGTLGSGNHFIEICIDEAEQVWFMLHSGSRGVGNRIGRYFIEGAKEAMRQWFIELPDADLAYFPEGTQGFDDYVEAVSWAQEFARMNREVMMRAVIDAVAATALVPAFDATLAVINCHHNYVAREHHFGKDVFVTRKGAVRAREGDLGIIPGSMGARSFIVRGRGQPDSFCSCSHGAGRRMSRTEAKRRFTLDDHVEATRGVECRKDIDVIDETPAAYKSIDEVMHAQRDLVEVLHTLRQVVCVKG